MDTPKGKPRQLQLIRRCRWRLWIVVTAAAGVLFNISTSSSFNKLSKCYVPTLSVDHLLGPSSSTRRRQRRFAVVNYVDKRYLQGYLYGVYSQNNQLKKLGMFDRNGKSSTMSHFVLLSDLVDDNTTKLLQSWVGEENVRKMDPELIRGKLEIGVRGDKHRLWPQVFSKLEAFNLTQFDKVVMLDNDILIRNNIEHWFYDYPTPAATGSGREIEWNSGAMVITPDQNLFETILDYLPKVSKFVPDAPRSTDNWNSGHGHQGFLSSFFTSNVTSETMYTMPIAASLLSSALKQQTPNKYFWRYRNSMIDTVHLTLHKPWTKSTGRETDAEVCQVLKEWKESVSGARDIPEMEPLPDYLSGCLNSSVISVSPPTGDRKPEYAVKDWSTIKNNPSNVNEKSSKIKKNSTKIKKNRDKLKKKPRKKRVTSFQAPRGGETNI